MGKKPKKKIQWKFLLFGIFLATIATYVGFKIYFQDRIYPAIYIAGVNVSALTYSEADRTIQEGLYQRLNKQLEFDYQGKKYNLDLKDAVIVNNSKALDEAFRYGRFKLYYFRVFIPTDVEFLPRFDSQLKIIEGEVNQPPVDAQVLVSDAQITATPSQEGKELDRERVKLRIRQYLNSGDPSVNLPIKTAYPKLSYQGALDMKKALDQIKLTPIQLIFKDRSWQMDLNTVLSLIDLKNTRSKDAGEQDIIIALDDIKIGKYLENISSQIDQEIKEPLFAFDGARVVEFQPPQEGRKLNTEKTSLLISQAITQSHDGQEVVLPVEIIEPKNKLSNEMGIKELVGRGISHFKGSIENRIFNIKLAASRINGVLIDPNETFSFNKTVGDISAASGYKQAYVIKSGRTVLDDGGGVCQVSTTLFRSVLNAGLPVVARTAHAYRVGYYEQGFPPGLDATVFSPSIDFQFKNDSDYHLLIQAYAVGTSLYIDLYGTKDGRVSKISSSTVTNQTPAPEPLYQDDPTLPVGQTKQVDWAAVGANVSFTRTVTRDGQTLINETFRSNYRPWQAVYLVGKKEN